MNFLQKLNKGLGRGIAMRSYSTASQLNADAFGYRTEKIKKLQYGDKYYPKTIFSDEEMDSRLNILENEIMNEMNVDYVLLTSHHNINYYSNFLYIAFGRKFGLFIDNNGNKTTITTNVDGATPFRNQYHKIDNIVYTDWDKDNYFYAIATLMMKENKNSIKIGVEYDHMSLEFMQTLEQYLFNHFNSNIKIEFVDVSKNLTQKRMIKSKEEHALIKNGVHITTVAGHKCMEYLKETKANNARVTELELSSFGTDIINTEIAKMYPHSDFRDSWCWFHTGLYNSDGAHNPPTLTNIEYGDNISMNIFPMINGYYAALERTLFYGDIPSDYHLKFWELNCKVLEKGVSLIKPGVKCSEIAHELNELYLMETPQEFYGNVFDETYKNVLYFRQFGYGHSMGIVSQYFGRESGLELREDCDTVLKEGMVITMEPSLFIPHPINGYGTYREHDILIVNENGSENITNFPYGPEKCII